MKLSERSSEIREPIEGEVKWIEEEYRTGDELR
jgi:hypothetical protein